VPVLVDSIPFGNTVRHGEAGWRQPSAILPICAVKSTMSLTLWR